MGKLKELFPQLARQKKTLVEVNANKVKVKKNEQMNATLRPCKNHEKYPITIAWKEKRLKAFARPQYVSSSRVLAVQSMAVLLFY